MASRASIAVAMKILLFVLYIAMIASFVYVFVINHIKECYNWTLRWDVLLVINCTVLYVFSAIWFYYKELSWIKTLLFFIGMEISGSIVTIPYIFYQFWKLTPEEASRDPIYFVLARQKKRDQDVTKRTSVATGRVIFIALGVLLLATIIYTVIMDILVYYADQVTPCLVTYMVDIYIYALLLSVWVAYKESSWISAFVWIILNVLSATIVMSVYVVWELYKLSPEQPTSLILFNDKDRELESSDAPLMSHASV
ncbi:hypothetical protein LXL04_014243 [Taraxacum kok-saghyz]